MVNSSRIKRDRWPGSLTLYEAKHMDTIVINFKRKEREGTLGELLRALNENYFFDWKWFRPGSRTED